MGRIILVMNVTLNGCVDHTRMIADEEVHRYSMDLMDRSDGLLFGRTIYRLMESAWPDIARSGEGPPYIVEFARRIDAIPKYVVSRTLETVAWRNSHLLKGPVAEEIPRLKAAGMTLLGNAGPGLGSALAQLGLVDEYHFLVQPRVVEGGPQLLGGVLGQLDLTLAETRPFRSGVVLLRYEPVR